MASNNLKFQISAVDRTKQAFSGIKKGLGAVTKSVFNLKTALVGAVGIGGIGLLVKNSLEATDRIGKLSGVLGISAKDLQTFRLASQIGGIELETFAKGVRRFTDNIGDFKIGVGEAKVAFEQLGISQSDVLAIENDQVALLGLVADKLNEVESGAIKTKLAIEIFGGRGAELINVLDGGSDALKAFAKESERYGSLTELQVSQVEEFNDSVVRLKTAFFGIVNQLVANVSPALLKLSELLKEKLLKSFEDGQGGIKKFAQDGAKNILIFAQKTIQSFESFGNATVNTINNLIEVFNSIPFVKDVRPITVKFDFSQAIGEIDKLKKELDKPVAQTKKIGSNIEDIGKQVKKTNPFIETLTDRLKRLEASSRQFGDAIANGFEKAALEGQRLKETIREIGKEIIKIAFRKAITEPAGEAIGGAVKGVLGSIIKGVSGKRATGGSVQGGNAYLVGERGAEVFIPNRTGMIVPNNALGGGSVNVTQNLNIMPNVSDTVRSEIFSALPLIREQAVQAVIDARSRGGVATKALGLK